MRPSSPRLALSALITTLTILASALPAPGRPAPTPRQILPSGPSTSPGPAPPPHTAIITTTLVAPPASGPIDVIVVATITVIMRETEPLWPTDGIAIPGTVISAIGMTSWLPGSNSSVVTRRGWTETAIWELRGNSRTQSPDRAQTDSAPGMAAESVHTTWSRMYGTFAPDWAGVSVAQWYQREKVTLRERAGGSPGWPETITRTGETVRFVTREESWGTHSEDKPFSSEWTEGTYTRYTTMVRVR